ncbi:MAG: hypothetical protein WA790_02905 [Sulfitobacter sp.]
MADTSPKTKPSSLDLVDTLERVLRAESRFLRRLKDETAKRCRITSDVTTIQRELNHENIFHVARFFFLLKALDCNTPATVDALIEQHNARIKSLLSAGDYQLRTEKELTKALFKEAQLFVCVKTVREHGRAVFAKSEIASLLYEHMTRSSAMTVLDLLVRAGLLIEEDSDPLTGSNRKLIKTDGVLEDAVAKYLGDVEQGITKK